MTTPLPWQPECAITRRPPPGQSVSAISAWSTPGRTGSARPRATASIDSYATGASAVARSPAACMAAWIQALAASLRYSHITEWNSTGQTPGRR